MNLSQVFAPALVALLLITCGVPAPRSFAEKNANSKQETVEPAEMFVEHDELKRISRITIPSVDGNIAWNDVLRGLTQAGRLDDVALRAMLPDGQIDITTAGSRFTIAALNLALSPEIHLQVLPVSSTRPTVALLVTLDKREMGKTRRDLKAWIRRSIESRGQPDGKGRFGLRLGEGWQEADPKKHLVLVMHGFNSAPSQITGLVNAVQKSELPLGTYAYPNDQPIAASAQRLSDDLKQLAADHPRRRLALVTHSMGGLVARAVIENPKLDPGNVAKLIMVAPPTHGSQLAHLSFGVEIWEYLIRPSEASQVSRFYAAVEDGLAEADYDLRPDSDFLRELNGRGRNKQVQYSLFLGTDGLLSPEQLQRLRDTIDQAAKQSKAVQLVRPHFQEILGDFDEVLAGKGDGVVAVKRGRLEGVQDTVLLKFTHLGPTSNSPSQDDRKLQEEVRLRLKR